MMQRKTLLIDPKDNIVVALQSLNAGSRVDVEGEVIVLKEDIPEKHKFNRQDLLKGDDVLMYGVLVGTATEDIQKGSRITQQNISHNTHKYVIGARKTEWKKPDITRYKDRTFLGYRRADGRVGTMNYWLVIPMVFCENRNVNVIKKAMLEQLGYATDDDFSVDTQKLIDLYRHGADEQSMLTADIIQDQSVRQRNRIFPNVDGIKFLTHEGGCGCTRQDSDALCRLLAGYIANPNVAGATVLSLGCQNAEISILQKALQEFLGGHQKPVFVLEQQKSASERDLISQAVKHTFVGMSRANRIARESVGLHHLCLGLECGGSDGFSGITANPALGYTSDLLVALGGKTILAEFPELNGVEQELINRCYTKKTAHKFASLMDAYAKRAKASGSGFNMNPSPGNIRDGLITDAIKSAGAAKKGGTSPIMDVLDYTEQVTRPGLNLLCTPGGDIESTTGLTGSGANILVFTTGLGTPTGNVIAPTIKVSSNSMLAKRMPDLIDFDAGTVLTGVETIHSLGEALLEYIIEVASGKKITNATRLGQDDFIPWKRGISL